MLLDYGAGQGNGEAVGLRRFQTGARATSPPH